MDSDNKIANSTDWSVSCSVDIVNNFVCPKENCIYMCHDNAKNAYAR